MRSSLGIGFLALAWTAHGQAWPAFEVASVKPSTDAETTIGMRLYPGGRLTITHATLHDLIGDAYHVPAFQVVGGPKWSDDDEFSVVAKPPAISASSRITPANPRTAPPEEERLMLRELLAARFQLKLHPEKRDGTVYVLKVGEHGPRLQAPKDREMFPVLWGRGGSGRPDSMDGHNVSMALLAERLERELERPVKDQTGLKDAYDFFFEYEGDEAAGKAGPPLTRAVEKLGLRLVKQKGLIEYLVIDHAERRSGN